MKIKHGMVQVILLSVCLDSCEVHICGACASWPLCHIPMYVCKDISLNRVCVSTHANKSTFTYSVVLFYTFLLGIKCC